MSALAARSPSRLGRRLASGVVALTGAGLGTVLAVLLLFTAFPPEGCGPAAVGGPAGASAAVLAAGAGAPGSGAAAVGATEYGGPGDPASGTIGSSGISLAAHPDSFAELGGTSFGSATALGGLPYLAGLRVSWGARSAIAYKRDIGLGGGPVDGLPRAIDLWWRFAAVLGIPYQDGRWSGAVRVAPAPAAGAAGVLGEAGSVGSVASSAASGAWSAASKASTSASASASACAAAGQAIAPVAPGPRALLLPGGLAAAPAGAPDAVRGIIAAGNEIAGRPYLYGAAHGLPLDEVAPAYDCSSSVEHLLYGGGLLPVGYGAASSALESFGQPGVGRWVTVEANPDHVFLYVAGLRWDTWNAAGPGDGSAGIGWHPLVRGDAGFVARHPVGL